MWLALFWNRAEIKRVMEIVKKRVETGVECSAIDVLDEEKSTNATLRALAPLYEKYEPYAWWYGVFSIYVRLLETAFLVLIPNPIMKTLFASCVSVVSIIVQREVEPWLKDRTDIVANAGCLLYTSPSPRDRG